MKATADVFVSIARPCAMIAVLIGGLAGAASAQDGGGSPGRPGPGGGRMPPPGQPGPWDRDVVVYRVSPDGAAERVAVFERAGVPTLARLGNGRLIAAHQHFPEGRPEEFDKVAVRFSEDEGRTWSAAEVIRLEGLPEGMRFPFDPTLAPLPDGRVRLYFTSTRLGAGGPTGQPAIYSAVSEDGIRYVFEPGLRFGVEGRAVIDCAVVLHQGVFHLYAPDNGTLRMPGGPGGQAPGAPTAAPPPGERLRPGTGYHATSDDGLNFARQEDVRIEGRRRWLGNAQSDGRRIVFHGTAEGPDAGRAPGGPPGGPPKGSLWVGASEDGKSWSVEDAPAIVGADPGAVATGDGGWVIAVTGGPRPGTPSARQGPR